MCAATPERIPAPPAPPAREATADGAPRVAFIASSGGGILDAVCRAPSTARGRAIVAGLLTDRPCGAESVAEAHGVPWARLEDADGDRWSSWAAARLARWRPDVIVLLFLRRVSPDVWDFPGATVLNLHPSLLPDHRGLRGLAECVEAGAAPAVTLHHVTDALDAGPIVAQARGPHSLADAPERAAHSAFLLELALLLAALCERAGDSRTLPSIAQERIDEVEWVARRGLSFRGLVPSSAVLDTARSFARGWALPTLTSSATASAAERAVEDAAR